MANNQFHDPPKWIIILLEWICPDELFESILGDLLEEFEENISKKGSLKAKILFLWTALRFFHPYILIKNKKVKKITNMGMYKSHLTVMLRSMSKYKLKKKRKKNCFVFSFPFLL